MASKGGRWCLVCGALVKAEQMGHHLWGHGIIHSDRRQGYRAGNGQPPAPLGQASIGQLDEPTIGMGALVESVPAPLGSPAVGVDGPRQAGLFGE